MNAQSISIQIRIKVGVSVILRHNSHWVKSNFKMTFEPNRGDARCPEIQAFMCKDTVCCEDVRHCDISAVVSVMNLACQIGWYVRYHHNNSVIVFTILPATRWAEFHHSSTIINKVHLFIIFIFHLTCSAYYMPVYIEISDFWYLKIFQSILLDILTYPEGPRVRDHLSHGEMDISAFPASLANHILCVCAALCLAFTDSCSASLTRMPLMHKIHQDSLAYQSQFHPITQLKKEVGAHFLNHLYVKSDLVNYEHWR